jgi:hypothetical protein
MILLIVRYLITTATRRGHLTGRRGPSGASMGAAPPYGRSAGTRSGRPSGTAMQPLAEHARSSGVTE